MRALRQIKVQLRRVSANIRNFLASTVCAMHSHNTN